jgi:hypothetical protein
MANRGKRTSGWRTSFDCFERAGQRLCLPGRALAAAPAPNSPPCQPCLTLSGTFLGPNPAVVPKPTDEANCCNLRHVTPKTLQKALYVGFSQISQPL